MNDKDVPSGPANVAEGIPESTHRWNFWVSSVESAFFVAGANMIGPMTLIPFLFAQIGIDESWLGLFNIATFAGALGGPLGLVLIAGRRRRLPLSLVIGGLQRMAFMIIPLGAMFFFGSPTTLLYLLTICYLLSQFFGGMNWPIYQTIITTGVRESWWGRMMGVRSCLAAVSGLFASAFMWWANRLLHVPTNYVVMGWAGVITLYLSLYLCSWIREIPAQPESEAHCATIKQAFGAILDVFRGERRNLALILTHSVRSFGFLLGTYMTAVFIERCHLTEQQMWIPVACVAFPEMVSHLVTGALVDRFGPRLALVLSACMVAINSWQILYCQSIPAFVVLFACGTFGGSLMNNAWPTLIVKLAAPKVRPAYISGFNLASAPFTIATSILGILLVRYTHYQYVFHVSLIGGLVAMVLYWFVVPDMRAHAAEEG